MIVFEGPDNVGKTTTGLKLSDLMRYGFYRRRVQHCMLAETIKTFEFESTVIDRFWMTDRVYSAVHGRAPGLSRTDLYKVVLMAERMVTLNVVMCESDVQYIGEQTSTHEISLHREYYKVLSGDRWFSPSPAALLHVLPKPDLIDECLELIQKCARIRRATIDEAVSASDNRWISGSVSPSIVFWYDDKMSTAPKLWVEDIVADLFYAAGVKPSELAIVSGGSESSLEKFIDHTKAKVCIKRSSLKLADSEFNRPLRKMAIKDAVFQQVLESLKTQLGQQGINTAPLEETNECR